MNKFKSVQSCAYKIAKALGYSAYLTCVMHCVLEYVGDFVLCFGPSMEPTIISENIVLTDHWSVLQGKISRGDIVISKNPFSPKHFICKRVKALPGDKIRSGFFSEIVPQGHIWLEGDNKYNSTDSRMYGPVPIGLIRGRVTFIIWPFSRFKKLTNYAEQRI